MFKVVSSLRRYTQLHIGLLTPTGMSGLVFKLNVGRKCVASKLPLANLVLVLQRVFYSKLYSRPLSRYNVMGCGGGGGGGGGG